MTGASAALVVAAAESHVTDPVGMVEGMVAELGEPLAAAVLALEPPTETGVLDLLDGVVSTGGALARLRLGYWLVSAVRLAAGAGAAALWMRLPDPLLDWEPAGLVLAAWPAVEAEPVLARSAAALIGEIGPG
ncbi:MAG: hypothetical protein LC789_14645 [Actinobacteria bacterium]|nr:hypothetical protein [Actinomycetota bacterium]